MSWSRICITPYKNKFVFNSYPAATIWQSPVIVTSFSSPSIIRSAAEPVNFIRYVIKAIWLQNSVLEPIVYKTEVLLFSRDGVSIASALQNGVLEQVKGQPLEWGAEITAPYRRSSFNSFVTIWSNPWGWSIEPRCRWFFEYTVGRSPAKPQRFPRQGIAFGMKLNSEFPNPIGWICTPPQSARLSAWAE